jgi:UDP-N-acetylglucosamine acyltransferase
VTNTIHETAIVDKEAQLGEGNIIGPYAIIESGVQIGDQNRIAAHVVLKQGTQLGNRNQIAEQAVIAGIPQDLKFTDLNLPTFVRLGDDNVLRENVTINRAGKEGMATTLGNGNFMMCNTHIGHDCVVGDNNVFAPDMGLGGHVTMENNSFVSGGVMVHQFVHIGSYAMIGGNSKITQDVLPYMLVDGNPARVRSLNIVGLKRAGFTRDDIKALKAAFRLIFNQSGDLEASLAQAVALKNPLADHLIERVRASKRGFHRAE